LLREELRKVVLSDFIRLRLVAGRMRTDFEPNLNDVGNRHSISSDSGPKDRLLENWNSHKDISPVFGAVWRKSQTVQNFPIQILYIEVGEDSLNRAKSQGFSRGK